MRSESSRAPARTVHTPREDGGAAPSRMPSRLANCDDEMILVRC